MRIRDIIFEGDDTFGTPNEAIEDEAETRGDAALITALEWLRNEAAQSNAVTPRVKVDTVIERVRAIPGNEAFNYANLDAAIKSNESVKNMVQGTPKDDPQTGGKYLYLAPAENTIDDTEGQMDNTGGGNPKDPAKVVGAMAKRAANK